MACSVCQWYAQLDEADRMAFDAVLDNGGNKTDLWRKVTTWPEAPLDVSRVWFSQCVNYHKRGGARVAV